MCKALLLILSLACPVLLCAQHISKNTFIIDSFRIIGTVYTDSLIIIRELPVHTGQEINETESFYYLDEIHNRLMRTGLFLQVTALIEAIPGKGNHVVVKISAYEKPRIYIIPEVDVYDRNPNVWWVEHNHDFSRIIAGVNVRFNNIFGQAHSLTFRTYFGALNSYSLVYNVPFVNVSHTISCKGGINFARQKIVGFETVNNKQEFLYSQNFERGYTKAFFNFSHRITYRWHQAIEFDYYYDRSRPAVLDSNPVFYGKGLRRIRYADLSYRVTLDTRNNLDYPLTGYLLSIAGGYAQGINTPQVKYPHIEGGAYYYAPLNQRLFLSLLSRTAIRFSNNLSYPLQQALGYKEDYISGYEYYVVDGAGFWINKAALKYTLFNKNIKPYKALNRKGNAEVPVMLLPKIYFEEGYVRNLQTAGMGNTLVNRFLPGAGIGLDAVLYYDINFRFEYSFNYQMHHSLFLHFKSVF